jgi:FAD:protein FMN transferase
MSLNHHSSAPTAVPHPTAPAAPRRAFPALRLAGALPCLALAAALSGCRRPVEIHNASWPIMGTMATLSVASRNAETADKLEAETRAVFDRINRDLSVYLPDSRIAQLNRAGTNAVALGPDALAALTACREFATISDGAFDPTVMPLVRLWGFSGGHTPTGMPTSAAIAAARARVGIEHLQVVGAQARFARPAMSIDLGGIAKGFAVDRAFDALTRAGAPPLLINLGGNMRGHGQPATRRNWRIGVRNPLDRQAIVGILNLPPGMATATSGNYERFVTIAGRRYAHIIDPVSGHPVTGMAGVTVLAPTAIEADALSTSLFVMGLEKGADLVNRRPGCSAVFIPDRQPIELWITPRFARHFTPEPPFATHVHRLE